MAHKEKKWLADQVSSAKRNLDNLPGWVRKSARFEGADGRSFVAAGRSVREPQKKK